MDKKELKQIAEKIYNDTRPLCRICRKRCVHTGKVWKFLIIWTIKNCLKNGYKIEEVKKLIRDRQEETYRKKGWLYEDKGE